METFQEEMNNSDVTLKDGERLDYLPGSDLKIIQSDATFALSTDTMFLGRFAHVRSPKNQRVIDFCTGTGAMLLMLSEKTAGQIEGIELQPSIADMATRTVEVNGLSDQIQIHTANIKDAKSMYPPNSLHVITCNPPYFKHFEASKINTNTQRAIARHEIEMTLADVFEQSAYLLRDKGKLCLVHRPERLTEMVRFADQYGFGMRRLQFIYPRAGEPANTMLVEWMKAGRENAAKILSPITVYADKTQEYTEQAKTILYGNA